MSACRLSGRLSKGSRRRASRSAPAWVNRTESAARGPSPGLERLESRLLLAGNAIAADHLHLEQDFGDPVPIVVDFPDANLEQVIREAIGKPSGDIYDSDLRQLQRLYAGARGIVDLEGLQYATSLRTLDLSYNQISDMTAVQGMTSLHLLDLRSNQISDMTAVQGLTNLQELHLDSNQISDMTAVQGLSSLQELHLESNRISDMAAVQGLTNLQGLFLSSNQISDMTAVQGLTNLQGLFLSSNQISDMTAVRGLTNLQGLHLGANQISDMTAVQGLTSLQGLYLGSNQISDMTAVQGLTNLQGLYLWSNQIRDAASLVANPGMGDGDEVYLWGNPLSIPAYAEQVPVLRARGVTVYVDEPGALRGTIWRDADGDGSRDSDEAGLAGWTVYLDLHENGMLDPDEPTAVTGEDDPGTPHTDESGAYSIGNLSPGPYTVRALLQDGWEQTFPWSGGPHRVDVVSGQTVEAVHFGNRDATPDAPPYVTGVLVRGAVWHESLLAYLDANGKGVGGYSIPVGHESQWTPLPWANLNQIRLRFSEDVAVEQGSLQLRGVSETLLDVADFAYEPATFTAVWTLNSALAADKLWIRLVDTITDLAGNRLDGEWIQGQSTVSGDAVPGGDFLFRFNVLPGDISQDGVVSIRDMGPMRAALGSTTARANYSIFADLNGDGAVGGADIGPLRGNLGRKLPDEEPMLPPSAPAFAGALVDGAVTRGGALSLAVDGRDGDGDVLTIAAVRDNPPLVSHIRRGNRLARLRIVGRYPVTPVGDILSRARDSGYRRRRFQPGQESGRWAYVEGWSVGRHVAGVEASGAAV